MMYLVCDCGDYKEISSYCVKDAFVEYLKFLFGKSKTFINEIPSGSPFHESEDIVIIDTEQKQKTFVYCEWSDDLVYYW